MRMNELRLPCGCETWTWGGVFYIRPCNKNCENYRYAVKRSMERGNRMVMREEP